MTAFANAAIALGFMGGLLFTGAMVGVCVGWGI